MTVDFRGHPMVGRSARSAVIAAACALLCLAAPVVAQQPEDQQMPAPPAQPAPPHPPGMPAEVAAALREIGPRIEGPRTTALYAPLQAAVKSGNVNVLRDLPYGPHQRHRADVFVPATSGAGRAALVFVHGGGFSRGAKSAPDSPFYDNIGLWAAREGLIGVTINYRLSPQFKYPSGAEDVARVVQWLRGEVRNWGGDPARIYLFGHSAGGSHVADYLVRTSNPQVAGAVLLSGIYDPGEGGTLWKDYYGDDVSRYPAMSSLPRLASVDTPLLVASGELDAPNFVADFDKLVEQRRAIGKPMTVVRLPNHSHLSEAYAVGTADESLTRPILEFVR
jgi:acetyl esterase/lipase